VGSERIDRFIEAMFRKRADHLLFATGSPVRIRTAGEEKVILDRAVRTEQILKLLRPIAEGRAFTAPGEQSFYYDAPSGRVHVRTLVQGDRMSAIVSPQLEGVYAGDSFTEDAQPVEVEPAPPSRPEAASPPSALPAEVPAPGSVDIELPARGRAGPRAIDPILRQLVEVGGSDLHLTAGHPPMVRKDGAIGPLEGWTPLDSETIEAWLLGAAHDGAREQFLETHDADFAHEIEGVARFRMNVFRDRNGVGGVMRTIPSTVLTADQLGLPDVVRRFCALPKGLVLVTGPTGSGKSTTLAAMVDLINDTRSDHIITIEDPVEFVHRSKTCLVNQREVHTHTRSFAAALRAALREDPDVVLVGELRDLETVHIAIETAETGHLVFGTLHTNTAASTVDRIIDQFPTDQQAQIRVMLSESLKGVISQTLCRRVGGGRVAALEILAVNHAVSNLIREGKTFQIPSIMQTGKAQGMQTQADALLALVKEGAVAPSEAYTRAVDAAAVKGLLERAGHRIE
jgi:twitching motility protein PilT